MSPYRNQRGQSLIETIVALGVITVALSGSISLAIFSLRAVGTSQNRLVALHLSWEGIEVAQHIRDSNYLAGAAFNAGLNGGADTTAIATFDPATNTWLMDFSATTMNDNSAQLFQQGGVYQQSSLVIAGTATPFRRLLTIDNSVADEVRVVSTVQWTEGSDTRSVDAERIFYDWR